MEAGEELLNLDFVEFPYEDSGSVGKRVCAGVCGRPVSVCLCDKMPLEPMSTSTRIVILHHPHEQRHKLSTVPVLLKCLRNCQTLIGRRLKFGSSAVLDSLYSDAVQNPSLTHRAIFLFPGSDSMPSIEVDQWRSSLVDGSMNNYVMIVFDGTWKHAKEMVSASLPFLSKFATRVCLKYDVEVDGGCIFDSELILRKEPFGGCMSTMEAVARALRVLEPAGIELENRLVHILKEMVRLQACHLNPMKPRPKLLKKKMEGKDKTQLTA
ncbi:hypothetical protein Nepgr_022001 [Nepenthes gracilis]|uniref:tRNA-uridine aminocarboxypropyltransferase n=1 Tax=Nepenthes gracilis TaxID=150966 RepID=A0AAD3XXR4_NEPGR|nr:hypothetical protein Nepgr_022001 [Nepenthes gracilis]